MRKIIFVISMLMLVPLASAGEWRGEGTPLYTIAEGAVHGGIYVGGGHGLTYESPYREYFDLPDNIEYARLYVSMWNYNEGDWVEVSINEKKFGHKGEPDYVAAWGVCNYAFTMKDEFSPGLNNISVTYHNTNGAPYSIVLVAVYRNDTMPQTRFWITEGNHALSEMGKIDNAEVIFESESLEAITNATLWTMMIAGNEGEMDTLYFNSHLLGEDVGRRKSGAYFDLDRWDVTEFMVNANNSVRFERCDELYIHPFNAILSAEYREDQGEDYLHINQKAESKKTTVPVAVIAVMLISIVFLVYRIRRKK